MRTFFLAVQVVVAILMLSLPALAAGTEPIQVGYVKAPQGGIDRKPIEDRDLALKSTEFERFAKMKVAQMNRNHRFSRDRMEIVKQPDGGYRARYHQIDDSSLSVKVSRSSSRTVPYVGILSYREQVFETSAVSRDQLGRSSFHVVKVIPNRHIFSFMNGVWN